MADTKLTGLTAATTVDLADDLFYMVVDSTGTPISRKIIPANAFLPVNGATVTALGSNPTSWSVANLYYARATATYTANTTLTLSNITYLNSFSLQITNTNANVITFAGVTLYFKSDDLPTGVTFASNALTFPGDTAIKYNLVAEKFDGSTFDCKIEIR